MATTKTQINDSLDTEQFSIELVESLEDLFPIRDQIDALSNTPFLKSTWMFPWIETYCVSGDCELCFLVVRNREARVIGFAPVVIRESLSRGRHFTFVGSGKCCADYMTFPAAIGHESAVAGSLASWCLENDNLWDRIELDGVEINDPVISEFATHLESHGNHVEAVDILPSYRVPLPSSWDELLKTLSKNSRKKYRRQARDLVGLSQVHQATDEKSLCQGLEILETLHTERWNALGEGGCFSFPGFGDFLGAMAKEKFDAGTLSLIWMTVEGQPIAADIAYYSGGGIFTYQGGISQSHLHLEPGRAIIKSQIEVAMKNGATFIDFLRGDEPYKSRFKAEKIDNVRYEIASKSIRGRMIESMIKIGRLAKSLSKFS